jgi:hypothetical protein
MDASLDRNAHAHFTGIDKHDHAANACAQVGETIAFDEAIGVAMDYQAKHPTRSWWSPPTTPAQARSSPSTPRGSR